MSTPGGEQERRAQRRAVAMRHHPDRGGDPAEFARLMAELDRPTAPAVAPGPVTVTGPGPVRRALRTAARAGRDAATRVRRRLPRRAPGARRYIDL